MPGRGSTVHTHGKKSEIKGNYRDVKRGARNLLHDKNRLMNAMRYAGKREKDYEREEERNEEMGESRHGQAEGLNEDADKDAERIYERAEENLHMLQHANRQEQHAASHQRHQKIHDAVETLKYARKGKTYQKKGESKGDDTDDIENESELENIQKQMANLQKGVTATDSPSELSEELSVVFSVFSSSCLLGVGSVGLLIFFSVRRMRPAPVAKPLLG